MGFLFGHGTLAFKNLGLVWFFFNVTLKYTKNIEMMCEMFMALKCSLFLWWQNWIVSSHYSSLVAHIFPKTFEW